MVRDGGPFGWGLGGTHGEAQSGPSQAPLPSPRALCPQGPPHKPQINTDVLELLTSNSAAPPYPHLVPQAQAWGPDEAAPGSSPCPPSLPPGPPPG